MDEFGKSACNIFHSRLNRSVAALERILKDAAASAFFYVSWHFFSWSWAPMRTQQAVGPLFSSV